MNWPVPSSLEQIWRSSAFPMWLTLAAAGFFALILLVTLLRAEKSVANGALTVITLLAIGVAVAATIRGFDPGGAGASRGTQTFPSMMVVSPALSCIDDLAGETALTACEKVLFGSADAAAAAVSYAAARITQLTAFGDVATASRSMTPELEALRRSVERDRYGLMAYVLSVQHHCQPSQCAAYRSLTDYKQVASNMDERVYDGLILRYSASWGAPATLAASAGAIAALPPSFPTGKPTNAEFPSAASTPPVNIMIPEPASSAAAPASRPLPAANAQALTPGPRPSSPATAAKKQAAPKARVAPVQLAPAPGAPAPAADND